MPRSPLADHSPAPIPPVKVVSLFHPPTQFVKRANFLRGAELPRSHAPRGNERINANGRTSTETDPEPSMMANRSQAICVDSRSFAAKKEGSLWIPDGSKRTVVRSPLTDGRAGRLFSTTTASYTMLRWLAEQVNLRKISYQSGIHKEPKRILGRPLLFLVVLDLFKLGVHYVVRLPVGFAPGRLRARVGSRGTRCPARLLGIETLSHLGGGLA